MTIISIGEILWDVFPGSKERLGGAPFNFAVQARRLGHEVIFISAVADDDRGRRALERAAKLDLSTEFIQVVSGAPTGSVSVFLDAAGQPDFTIHRPAAYDSLQLDEAQLRKLAATNAEWIYYGTLFQADSNSRRQVHKLIGAMPTARRLYDINLRKNCYTPELVRELISMADAVKLNGDEAAEFPDYAACPVYSVTRGEHGCTVRIGRDRADCAAYPVTVVDLVGAGDAFAAGFLHGLGQGSSAADAGDFANRIGAAAAAQAGALPERTTV